MRHNDFLHKGDRGEFHEEDLTGVRRYAVEVEREDPAKPPIYWKLELPKVPFTFGENGVDREAFRKNFKPPAQAIRECVDAFKVERDPEWTDKEYRMVKKRVQSLIWDPPSEWVQRVHLETAEALGTQDYAALEVFPASGTAADVYHGIDTIMLYQHPEAGKLLVTLDYSERQKEVFKADILVTETGASLNHEFYPMTNDSFFDVPDLEHATRAQQGAIEQRRREKLGALIAKVCDYKRKNLKQDSLNDGHYKLYPIEGMLAGEKPEGRIKNLTDRHRSHFRRTVRRERQES